MAQAVRVVTVERGIDPRELALVAFGGAGPAARRADRRGARDAPRGGAAWRRRAVGARARGVRAPPRPRRERPARPATALDDARRWPRRSSGWASAAAHELGEPSAELRATYDLRYAGQAFELPIDGAPRARSGRAARAFDRAHEERYGYSDPDAELELVTIRVAAALPGAEPPAAARRMAERRGRARRCSTASGATPRCSAPARPSVDGPAIFELPGSTLVVPPGWHARADADGVVMER